MTATRGIQEESIKVVLVHTNHDLQTELTNSWALEVISKISVTHHLHGEEVNAGRLREKLQGLDTAIIAFYGHGSDAELLAHQLTPGQRAVLVGVSGNCILPSELALHKIYAVACSAGAKLGPALKVAGCEFIGYSEAFLIAPAFEDKFKSIVNNALIDWTRGATTSEVCNALRRAWQNLADDLKISRPKEPIRLSFRAVAAGFALMNAESLAC